MNIAIKSFIEDWQTNGNEKSDTQKFWTSLLRIVCNIELKTAHREHDAAVCEAYGWKKNISEDEIVARLFELYESLTEKKV